MNETDRVSDIYVRPCVNGNSSTGEYFNFSVVSSCHTDNCTALNTQPGASIASPIILCLTGISGQICALVYLHRSSRPSSHRTTFYVMLATLIWTDLIGKLITTPLPVLSYSYGHWIGGILTCNIHGYSMSVIGMVTHLLVAAMALERYLGIRCGYFYNRNVTIFRTRVVLISLWLFAIAFCSLPHFGIGEFKLHYPGTWCHINQHICLDHPWPNIIFSNSYATINLTCFCVIVICNLVVVGTLLKMRMTKFRPSTSCRQLSTTKKPREREIQMVILLVIITVTFICSWTAQDVLTIKNQIRPPPPNRNPLFDIKAIRLAALNQIIDPWSYIICRLVFRSKLWKICRGGIMGKVGSRRFSWRSDGSSVFQSFGGSKPKLNQSLKRTSLPSPRDMTMAAHIQLQDTFTHNKDLTLKASTEHSFNSESDHECKVDLQSCFSSKNSNKESKKSSYIAGTLAKLFRNSEKESYIQINMPDNTIKLTNNSPFLSPLPISLSLLCDSSNSNKPLCTSSFHGRHQDPRVTSASKFETTGNSDIHQDVDPPHAKLLQRSNSWCCPSEYNVGSSVLDTKSKEYLD